MAVELAPEALELGLTVARIAALSEIITGVVLALAAASLAGISKWLCRASGNFKCSVDREFTRGFTIAIGGGGTVVLAAVSLVYVINVWAWAGAFNPELWIAKQVLGW